MHKHLSDERLAALCDGSLTPAERERAEAGVAECADCRARFHETENVFLRLRPGASDGPDETFLDALESRILESMWYEKTAAIPPAADRPAGAVRPGKIAAFLSRTAALSSLAALALFALLWPGVKKESVPRYSEAPAAFQVQTPVYDLSSTDALGLNGLSAEEMTELTYNLAESAPLHVEADSAIDFDVPGDFQTALARLSDDELADLTLALNAGQE